MLPAHLTSLDLNLLVGLAHLFETRSVTGAAARLGLSQPAMSRALLRLRRSLGDPLFLRTSSGLVPTPRAQALQPQLDDVLARLGALVSPPLAFDPKTARRTFSVATADYGVSVLLPRLLEALRERAPGVSSSCVPSAIDWEGALLSGRCDVCWAPRKVKGSSRAVIWSQLFKERFAFVVAGSHPCARGRLTLDRFVSVPQVAIAPDGRPGNRTDEALLRLGRERQVVAWVPTFLSVPPLLQGGQLGAVLPARIVAQVAAHYGLAVRELPLELGGFDLSQAWHERMRHEPGHAWFRQLVREVAQAA
jgi:DNA-binding transcriptional LysR family regulator